MRIAPPFGYKEFIQRSNALPISYSEFQLVAREHPIVFTTSDAGKPYAPVSVLGVQANENVDRVERKERFVCVEKSFVDEERGEALFDAEGKPTAQWAAMERLLAEYEADLERSREMCALLGDYGLLEAFTRQATPGATGAVQLTGMYRVAEKNLENLNAAQLKLENLARHLERKAASRGA